MIVRNRRHDRTTRHSLSARALGAGAL